MRVIGLVMVALALGVGCGKSEGSEHVDEADEIFRTACARCHGTLGNGGPPDPLGNPGPRNFTEKRFQDGITDDAIRSTIQNGKRGMPAFGAVFTPAQLTKLVARVRAFGPPGAAASAAAPSSSPSSSVR